jgi:DNA-binding response OmpR family regulator
MSAATPPSLPSSGSPSDSPLAIAIAVQDDPIGRLLALSLRLEGYQPHVLPRDGSALATLLREPYAAAIVDVHLTPVDGLTLYQRVRASVSTPIILMLMRDDVPEHIQAQRLGASPLLFLPFALEDLYACVRAVTTTLAMRDGTATLAESAGIESDGARSDGATRAAAVDPASASSAAVRVLLAIAVPGPRTAMRIELLDAGYTVVEAADGVAALDLLLGSPTPLVVILDLLLPNLSGHAVLARASSDPHVMRRHAFAVIANPSRPALRLDAQLEELLTTYAMPILDQPINGEQLLTLVRDLRMRVLSRDP